MRVSPLPVLLAGLAFLYLGERVLEGTARSVCSGVGAVALLAAIALAALRAGAAQNARRRAGYWLVTGYITIAGGLALYAIQSDWLGWLEDGMAFDLIRVAWPVVVVMGVAPTLAMELAMRSMKGAPKIELARVVRASRSALIVATTLVTFASINFVANRWNRKVDLSYFKTTQPSASTMALVEGLVEPVEVFAFFPAGNDVERRVADYTGELATLSANLQVIAADQALRPDLARELKVRSNGALVFRRGKNTETLNVSTDLADARRVLRKLDPEFQERLLRVTRPDRIAYFTTGHLERGWSRRAEDGRLPMSELRTLLESLGFDIKSYGLADGLGDALPEDATLVVVAGALEPMLESERDALLRYLKSGGTLLLLTEPDHGSPDTELLEGLGLTMSGEMVASQAGQIRIPGRALSPYNLATNQTTLHPISNSYRSTSRRLSYAILGGGALEAIDPAPENVELKLLVRTAAGAYVDNNSDGERQETEPSGAKNLVAAIEFESKEDPGRAVVLSDADAAANGVIRNAGNAFIVADAVRWMAGDEELGQGGTTSEEDVQILHRKDEDKIWFYGTTLASPALVLAFGLVYTRRRKRRHSRERQSGLCLIGA